MNVYMCKTRQCLYFQANQGIPPEAFFQSWLVMEHFISRVLFPRAEAGLKINKNRKIDSFCFDWHLSLQLRSWNCVLRSFDWNVSVSDTEILHVLINTDEYSHQITAVILISRWTRHIFIGRDCIAMNFRELTEYWIFCSVTVSRRISESLLNTLFCLLLEV